METLRCSPSGLESPLRPRNRKACRAGLKWGGGAGGLAVLDVVQRRRMSKSSLEDNVFQFLPLLSRNHSPALWIPQDNEIHKIEIVRNPKQLLRPLAVRYTF